MSSRNSDSVAMVSSEARRRDASLDLIRVMAMTLVVVCHLAPAVLGNHLAVFPVVAAFGRLGVPLFVMLTGYLMLGRTYDEATLERYVRRNVLGLLVAFEVWNVVWWALGQVPWLLPGGNGLPVTDEQAQYAALFVGDTGTALWYLHMTLALYLGIPVVSWALRRIAGAYRIVLAVCLLLCATIVPSVAALRISLRIEGGPIHPVLGMNVFSATVWGNSVWLLYLIVGHLARKYRDRLRASRIALAMLISVVAFAALNTYLALSGMFMCDGYDFVLVVTTSILLFLLMLCVDGRALSARLARAAGWVSERSFGVYVTHLWVMGAAFSALRVAGVYVEAHHSTPVAVALFLVCLPTVVVGSVAVVQALSLVGPIRQWALLMRRRKG